MAGVWASAGGRPASSVAPEPIADNSGEEKSPLLADASGATRLPVQPGTTMTPKSKSCFRASLDEPEPAKELFKLPIGDTSFGVTLGTLLKIIVACIMILFTSMVIMSEATFWNFWSFIPVRMTQEKFVNLTNNAFREFQESPCKVHKWADAARPGTGDTKIGKTPVVWVQVFAAFAYFVSACTDAAEIKITGLKDVVLFLLTIGVMLVIAGAISPFFWYEGDLSSSKRLAWALTESISKWIFAATVIAAIAPMCTDATFDGFAFLSFYSKGQMQYLCMNLAAVVVSACFACFTIFSNIGGSIIRQLIMASLAFTLVVLPVWIIVAALSLALLCSGSTSTRRFAGNLGIFTLISCLSQSEGFLEGIVSMSVQGYAVIHGHNQDNHSLLLILSTISSLLMLSKTFATCDARGHISQLEHGCPVVVGAAPATSVPFLMVAVYRLASVTSRFLLYILFQEAVHDDMVWHGMSYGGLAVFFLDGIIQAALICHTTKTLNRLLFFLPNCFSPLEPVLHRGDPIWTMTISYHAFAHLLEETTCVLVVLALRPHSLDHMIFLVGVFGASTIAKYLLLLLIREVCAYSVEASAFYGKHKVPLEMVWLGTDTTDLRNGTSEVMGESGWHDGHLTWIARKAKDSIAKVKQLYLGRSNVTDFGIQELARNCVNLEKILLNSTKVTDAGVQELARNCANLEKIWLPNTKVTDAGVQEIARNCPDLMKIDLDYTSVTDAGVQEIARNCPNLSDIRLGMTSVTDAGVQELARNCVNLEKIWLTSTKVTDAGVQELARGCPNLTTIDLRYTGVTDSGVKELKAKIPGISIVGK